VLATYTADLTGCLSNCSDNGNCVFTNDVYDCACFALYNGTRCEQDLNLCHSYPCANNGTCSLFRSDAGIYVYKCACANLYYGQNCENKIDVCANVTCSGAGNCVDNSSVAQCHCKNMYFGSNCQYQTTALVVQKAVVTTTTVIAIIVIVLFYSMFIFFDVTTFFGIGNPSGKAAKSGRKGLRETVDKTGKKRK
jgi:hypothetical protein